MESVLPHLVKNGHNAITKQSICVIMVSVYKIQVIAIYRMVVLLTNLLDVHTLANVRLTLLIANQSLNHYP